MHELLEIPVAASAHAAEIDRMTVLTHWLMAILFIGWGAFFIYTLVRFRQGANPEGELPWREEPHGQLYRVGRGGC